jgi:hypothetical protein
MLFFGFGALLVVIGLVELAGSPIWRMPIISCLLQARASSMLT